MKKINQRYWLFQFGGWGAFVLLYTFFYFTLSIKPKEQPHFFLQLFLEAGQGLIVTHIMRLLIKQTRLLDKKLNNQIIQLILFTIVFSLAFSMINIFMDERLGIEGPKMAEYSLYNKIIRTTFGCFLFLTIWTLIYFIYHYVGRSRREQVDKIRLIALVKELELKTIKAHINPHFIFNALNSIRALVDENPIRARTAITELSNILRSSMTSDKVETVSLEKELSIVKDYLALEQIRFEERLQIEMHIDEDTLDQPVPPMMLQTLVENAIKHGIGKTVAGGHIYIISDFTDNHHELIIRNTGHLNGGASEEGFGIGSTKNRLNLLYGDKAAFQIKDLNENEVEAKVTLPLSM
ncbi:MAG: histidine kinase [Chitinophagaceae bacterium]